MYLSRLTFHTLPGKTGEAEQAIQTLVAMVGHVGGIRPRPLGHARPRHRGSSPLDDACLGGRVMHRRAASTAWDWI